jgi:phosphomannomutase
LVSLFDFCHRGISLQPFLKTKSPPTNMTLIKSISGIRGTIGGSPGDTLSPIDVVKFSAAYGQMLKSGSTGPVKVVIGRDARPSGPMISELVKNTLIALGIDVLDLGLATTPTVEMIVPLEQAQGGIILTASHNPVNWNALKLLDHKGEFISAEKGAELLQIAEDESVEFVAVEDLGSVQRSEDHLEYHIQKILDLDLVQADLVAKAELKVAVDGVASVGGIAIPAMLKALGVKEVVELHCEPTGIFPHNPEPLEAHLTDIMELIREGEVDLGIVVDPDVDRLAFITEKGEMFGEEYTLVAVADYILGKKKTPTVSNLSSSRALADVAVKHGVEYQSSAVGEVNVVAKMKEIGAEIGGEGNGGIILPELHYGRDALVGTALFLSFMAESGKSASAIRASYPSYFMAKDKVSLSPGMDVDGILEKVKQKYQSEEINEIDGLKILFEREWVHLRKSNTEPIVRVYTESESVEKARELGDRFVREIQDLAS